MAIVGPRYNFLCIDVGGYGKNSDGGIFENSIMGRKFNKGTMNVPRAKILPRTNDVTPHVLIGDEAFRLQTYLMKPFNQRVCRVDRRKEKYNKRLCQARRVVENAFGLLAQKRRVYFKPMQLKVSTAKKVIKATCVLHNYLRSKTCNTSYLRNMYFNARQNYVPSNGNQNLEDWGSSGDNSVRTNTYRLC